MNKAYPSEVKFSFLTTVIIIFIILTIPAVRVLYSGSKDTYRIIENKFRVFNQIIQYVNCLLYTSPSPRDVEESRMPSSA